jgi:SAM-dependent methyltransferase
MPGRSRDGGWLEEPTIDAVRSYWERNPVAAAAVPHPLGAPEYFAYYDRLREANEPPAFAARLHEYPRFAGKAVLDVGCGNGYVLSRYALEGASVFGIDLTRTAVGLSRRRFDLMRLAGDFTVGNAECLPFRDRSFDCVCSMGVLHHTPDTRKAVAEVFRVLRPGGTVILMFYHRNSAQNRLKFPLTRWFSGKPMQQSINEVDGVGNPKGDVYSREELAVLLGLFHDVDLFAGVFPWHAMGRVRHAVPPAIRAVMERRWGWFLYAKGTRA